MSQTYGVNGASNSQNVWKLKKDPQINDVSEEIQNSQKNKMTFRCEHYVMENNSKAKRT